MADTIEVNVNGTTWVALVTPATSGFITNGSVSAMFYQESASQPGDGEGGHVLNPEDDFRYTLGTGQGIWGRLKSGSGVAVVTPD